MANMRIGIDVRSLSRLKTGIGSLTYNLLKNLIKISKDEQYFIYSCRDFDETFLNRASNVTIRRLNFPIGTLWTQTVLPIQLIKDKIDVFHSPETMTPIWGNVPAIATVNDLISFIHPFGHDVKARLAANLYPSVFKKSRKLIAISENTKRDLNSMFGIPEEKIDVVHISYDEDLFRPVEEPIRVLNKYNIKLPYILTVGVLSPRKNISRLVEATGDVLKRGLDTNLVVAGPMGWQYKDVFDKVKALGLNDRVQFIGPVPSSELPALYSGSSAFVFPSIYEGFGIPVLEAMACGAPVVASNTSSLPEVAGDAAVMVDPYKTNEIADAIYDLISNPEKAELFKKKGFERVRLFSWKKTAEDTLRIYREVAES